MYKRPLNSLVISGYMSMMFASHITPPPHTNTIKADIIPAATAALQAVIYSVSDELVKHEDAQKAIDTAKASTPQPLAKSNQSENEAKNGKTEKVVPTPPLSKEAIEKLLARSREKGNVGNLTLEVSQTLRLNAKDETTPKEVATKQIAYRPAESPKEPIFFGYTIDDNKLFIVADRMDSEKTVTTYLFTYEGQLINASRAYDGKVSEYSGNEAKEGFKALAMRWAKIAEKLPAPTKETVIASNDKGAAKDPTQKN